MTDGHPDIPLSLRQWACPSAPSMSILRGRTPGHDDFLSVRPDMLNVRLSA